MHSFPGLALAAVAFAVTGGCKDASAIDADAALVADAAADAANDATGAELDGAAPGIARLVAQIVRPASDVGPSTIDVVADVTGDGRDDVIATFGVSHVEILRLDGDQLVTAATIDRGDGEAFVGPRSLTVDLVGDGAPELVTTALYEGVLRAFATPMRGALTLADAVLTIEGKRNSLFAGVHARGGVLGGDGLALVLATPGEPEEACVTSEPPFLLALPFTGGDGEVAAVATARIVDGDPFNCIGGWMDAAHDWNGDGHADLVVANRFGGARVFAGPIAGERAFADGLLVPTGRGPYGGVGIAPGAVLDIDGDGALELGLVDAEAAVLRVFAAPIDPGRTHEIPLAAGAVLIDGPRVTDLDADGADLATLDDISHPRRLEVIAMPLGNGRRYEWDAPAPFMARSGDLDGDGRAEIIILESDRTISVLNAPE